MLKISPSILSANILNLKSDLDNLSNADYLHVDVMDGCFVPNLSFGLDTVRSISKYSSLKLDVHLMINNPERYVNEFIDNGADIVGIHIESTNHIMRVLQIIKERGIKSEVVINPGTPLTVLEEILPEVDQILIMSVNPGFGGQKFIKNSVDKIRRLSMLREVRGLEFDIEVDGGINDGNIKEVYESGVDIAVSGSYIFKDGKPDKNIDNLKKLVRYEKY